ncbi:hypothetical protein KC717_03595 [Candidatus Dojkabacteria bacterium]|uniref:Uncharacterized protein n=1 Tax=Candidatus Dojkabacteria bacterium TaxID=2099670 RepID=A0A955RKE6_9BACT|nr:hypothetical protein [Candidatus Dojkabacteria bacterium]
MGLGPTNTTFKKVVEHVGSLLFSICIVAGILIGGFHLAFRTDQYPNEVLGIQDSANNSLGLSILRDDIYVSQANDETVLLSSGLNGDHSVLFDNKNRSFIEGRALPNSSIELRLGPLNLSGKTDPNGFFSFPLPSDLDQFSLGQISVFDSSFQIKQSHRFVLILRYANERTYFMEPESNDVFSIVLPNDYTSQRDQFMKVESPSCSAEIDDSVSSQTFNILEDTNVVIAPSTISSLNEDENPYVAFRINPRFGIEAEEDCVRIWKDFVSTFEWHTSQITSALLPGLTNTEPLSSPVN